MPTEQLKYELTAQDKGVSRALGGIKTGIGALQQALPGAVAPLVEILEKSEQIGENFEKSGSKAQKALTGIGSVGLGVGIALQGLGSMEKAATGNLRNSIENLGLSWEDYNKQVEEVIKTGEHFGQTAANTQNILATLTQATNDPALALKYYNTVLDLSVAKHEDATTAATQLAQAYNGSARILHQFGIDGLKGQAAIDALAKKLKGDASTSADTFTGHVKAMGATLDDALSKFGEKFGPAITAVSGGMLGISASISAVNGVIGIFRGRQAAAAAAATQTAAALEAEGVAGVAAGEGVAEGAAVAEAGVSGLKMALISTGIGAVLVGIGTALTLAFGDSHKAQVEGLTAAVEADSGALGENARAAIATSVAKSDLGKVADDLGISLKDVTDGLMGNQAAMDRVHAAINAALPDIKSSNAATAEHGVAAGSAKMALDGLTKSTADQVSEAKAYADAMGPAATTTEALGSAALKAIVPLDGYEQAMSHVAQSNAELSPELAQTASQMDTQKVKAQALTDHLNAMNTALQTAVGINIDKKIAEGQLYAAGRDYAASIAKNGKTLDPRTAKGLANLQAQQAVQSAYAAYGTALTGDKHMTHDAQATALQKARDELLKLTGNVDIASGKNDKATASIDKQIASLKQQKVALGDNTSTYGMSQKQIESHRASVVRHAAAIDNHIGRLEAQKSAIEHGTTVVHLNAKEIDGITAAIGKVPAEWKTRMQLDDTAARLKGKQLKQFLEALDPTLRAKVELDMAAARAQFAGLMGIVNVGSPSAGGVPFLPGKAPNSKTTVNNFNIGTISTPDAKQVLREVEARARQATLAGVHVQ